MTEMDFFQLQERQLEKIIRQVEGSGIETRLSDRLGKTDEEALARKRVMDGEATHEDNELIVKMANDRITKAIMDALGRE